MSHHNTNNGSHSTKHAHSKEMSQTPWKSTHFGSSLSTPATAGMTAASAWADTNSSQTWQQGWAPSLSSVGRVFNSNQQPVQGFAPASWGWETADFNQAHAWNNATPWNQNAAFFEGANRPMWFTPPTCIAESSKFFCVSCELPGVNEKDIGVIWHDGTLVIRGQKHEFKFDDEFQVFGTDQTWGHFQRAIPMSHVAACIDSKKITTKWNNGILEVLLPKVTETTDSYFKVGSKK